MKVAPSFTWRIYSLSPSPISFVFVIALAALTAGCGSGRGNQPGSPVLSGNTQVAVLLEGTANGQLSSYDVPINSLTLTSKSGKTVQLLAAPEMADFIHLNGTSAPFVTVTVPQGVYTSASLTFQNALLSCETIGSSGGLVNAIYQISAGVQSATVELPSPLTITGSVMGLTLNLQVSESETLSACTSTASYTITPSFTLVPVMITPLPVNQNNGKLTGIKGRVVSTDATGQTFSLVTADCACAYPGYLSGSTISVGTNSTTVFQGISDFSGVSAGTFTDIDAAIHPDGSLMATRVQVWDPAATNLMIGPVAVLYSYDPMGTGPAMVDGGRQDQGDDLSTDPASLGFYTYGNATFQISGQSTTLQNLPFTASFDASHLIPGQNVGVSSSSIVTSGGGYTPATTLTLVPQTVNGTITSVSNIGSYQVYSVTLPAYDWIPTFNGATSIVAYVDSSTQLLNTKALNSGSVVRFTGLLFNDSGTLRLVCSQVEDGVAE